MSPLFVEFWSRFLNWLFRINTLEAVLIKTGAVILVPLLGINIVVEGQVLGQALRFSTAEGTAQWVLAVGIFLGTVCLLAGIALAITRFILEQRRQSRSKVIVIEVRGLRATVDAPLREARLNGIGRQREELLLDLRQGVRDGDIVDPVAALKRLAILPAQLQAAHSGRDRRDLQVVVGGLAPVPFLMLTGMYLDDESAALIADWDRLPKRWRTLDGYDDRQQLCITGLHEIAREAPEVVVAASVSYRITAATLAHSFPGVPIVTASVPNPQPDVHWSMARQQRLARQFRETIVMLTNHGVRRLHLALSVPAGLAIELGMGYDRRNMPSAIVYQYEPTPVPHYPWGILLPTHGIPEARIVPAPRAAAAERCREGGRSA